MSVPTLIPKTIDIDILSWVSKGRIKNISGQNHWIKGASQHGHEPGKDTLILVHYDEELRNQLDATSFYGDLAYPTEQNSPFPGRMDDDAVVLCISSIKPLKLNKELHNMALLVNQHQMQRLLAGHVNEGTGSVFMCPTKFSYHVMVGGITCPVVESWWYHPLEPPSSQADEHDMALPDEIHVTEEEKKEKETELPTQELEQGPPGGAAMTVDDEPMSPRTQVVSFIHGAPTKVKEIQSIHDDLIFQ
jgi:hypothetical protein